MYLNKDPTDTRKNHMLRPQSQRPTKVESSLMITAVVCVFSPRKPSDGKMSFDMSPICTGNGSANRVKSGQVVSSTTKVGRNLSLETLAVIKSKRGGRAYLV